MKQTLHIHYEPLHMSHNSELFQVHHSISTSLKDKDKIETRKKQQIGTKTIQIQTPNYNKIYCDSKISRKTMRLHKLKYIYVILSQINIINLSRR